MLSYGTGRGREVGLLPDIHIAVLAADRIVADLPTALALAYAGGGTPPSALTLVTGPSASSDIEKIRVTGVHGPRKVARRRRRLTRAPWARHSSRASSSATVSRRVASTLRPASTITAAARGTRLYVDAIDWL